MIKSELCESFYCSQQLNENMHLVTDIKIEECKIEGDYTSYMNSITSVEDGKMLAGLSEASCDKEANGFCKREQTNSDLLHAKILTINGQNEKTSLVQKSSDIKLEVLSDFDENHFDIETYPMELESATDKFVVLPAAIGKLSKKCNNKTPSNNCYKVRDENASESYDKQIKIILKDFLLDHRTNTKVVLKDISINLKNNGYCNNNDLKMKTATVSKSIKNAKRSEKTERQTVIKSQRYQRKREKLTCTHCTEIFVTKRQLNRHLWKEHRKEMHSNAKQLFACDMCEYKTNLKPCLKRHKWTHGIGEVKHCPECEYVTAITGALTQHINNVHKRSEKVLYKCEHCKRSFSWKYTLANHLLIYHKDKIDKRLDKIFIWKIKRCQYCDYRTIYEKHLIPHMVEKHSVVNDGNMMKCNGNMIKCYHCSYETHSKNSLITHLGSHSKRKFKCRYCEKTFNRQCLLDSHLLRKHEGLVEDMEKELGTRLYSCTLCNHKTLDARLLREHIAVKHREVAVVKYSCQLCDFTSDLRKDLHEHYQGEHDKEYYVCELCSKAYTEPHYLANHVLRSHNSKKGRELCKKYNYRVYLCKFCNDYKTTVQKSYKRHMHTIHGSEFRCTKCDFKTGREHYLKTHIKVNHSTNDNTFECIYCQNPRFKHKNSLANHILKQHSSEATEDTVLGYKVHYCSLCSYKDVVMAHITRHMRSMHTDL